MGVYIPNMEKPKSCWECFNADCNHWGEHGYDNTADCPLIEIGDIEYQAYKEFRTMLLKKIEDRILYGERRADGDI